MHVENQTIVCLKCRYLLEANKTDKHLQALKYIMHAHAFRQNESLQGCEKDLDTS